MHDLSWMYGFELPQRLGLRNVRELMRITTSKLAFTADNNLAVIGENRVGLVDIHARALVGWVAAPGTVIDPCNLGGSPAGYVAFSSYPVDHYIAQSTLKVYRRTGDQWDVLCEVRLCIRMGGVDLKFSADGNSLMVLSGDQLLEYNLRASPKPKPSKVFRLLHTSSAVEEDRVDRGWIVWSGTFVTWFSDAGVQRHDMSTCLLRKPGCAFFCHWHGGMLAAVRAADGRSQLVACIILGLCRFAWMTAVMRAVPSLCVYRT